MELPLQGSYITPWEAEIIAANEGPGRQKKKHFCTNIKGYGHVLEPLDIISWDRLFRIESAAHSFRILKVRKLVNPYLSKLVFPSDVHCKNVHVLHVLWFTTGIN